MINKLREYAADYGILLNEGQLESFSLYTERMLEYNQRVNLTAITDPGEILVKHYLDSLLPLAAHSFPEGARVIDVGTGAGFPGVPLKIAAPHLSLTLLDSLNKRLRFLEELGSALGQENRLIHGRAEDMAHDPSLREVFDVAVSRALASLPALVEYCLGFVRPGGVFLAMKSGDYEEEAKAAKRALAAMGGELERVEEYQLPGEYRRSILIIRKKSQTSAKYPRIRVNITKAPL